MSALWPHARAMEVLSGTILDEVIKLKTLGANDQTLAALLTLTYLGSAVINASGQLQAEIAANTARQTSGPNVKAESAVALQPDLAALSEMLVGSRAGEWHFEDGFATPVITVGRTTLAD